MHLHTSVMCLRGNCTTFWESAVLPSILAGRGEEYFRGLEHSSC
jgi:hypothetical protein